ncbi:hypothetical protein HFO06_28765 [Rhizobium leguminosarum]|uniref:hypothetical protein n=1 Tax=Rhizobium leguminosarum TaxID=384 RepID=UPI001C97DF52|nr:hypothetical protein [Rhizobium leguminosarum]MBY5767043.1 hypothetical protein [Rhizobium leguminosarum]
MLKAYETMMNKGMWVTWPDGNQYFVIKPEDFRELLAPAERVDEAADRQEEGRRARMPNPCRASPVPEIVAVGAFWAAA